MPSKFDHWLHNFKKSFPIQLPWLLAGIFGLSLMSWFLTTQAPEQGSTVAFGIFLIIATLFCFLQFFLNNVRRSIIVCFGGATFLILRALKLNDPLYFILLLLFLVSIELSTRNR